MIMPDLEAAYSGWPATQLNSCGEARKVGRGTETHALGLPDAAAYHAPRAIMLASIRAKGLSNKG